MNKLLLIPFVSIFAGCSHQSLDYRSPANVSLVEPTQLGTPGLNVGLPINRFYGFPDDVITIPINISEGTSYAPKDYEVFFELLMRSDQKAEWLKKYKDQVGPGDKPHWINGYTPGLANIKNPINSSGQIRIQRDLPIQKFLRWEVPQGLMPGSYKARIFVSDSNGNKVDEELIDIGVHASLSYSAILDGNVIQIRDVFGVKVVPSEVFLIRFDGAGSPVKAFPLSVSRETGDIVLTKDASVRRSDIIRAKVINGSPVDIPINFGTN